MRGFNEDEICDFVNLTRDKSINVRFIEFMPFDGNVWKATKLVSFLEMKEIVVGYWSLMHLCNQINSCFSRYLMLKIAGQKISFFTAA